MTDVSIRHRVPFEETTDETAWLWGERRSLSSLVEDQRVALASCERRLWEMERRLAAAERELKHQVRCRWWRR